CLAPKPQASSAETTRRLSAAADGNASSAAPGHAGSAHHLLRRLARCRGRLPGPRRGCTSKYAAADRTRGLDRHGAQRLVRDRPACLPSVPDRTRHVVGHTLGTAQALLGRHRPSANHTVLANTALRVPSSDLLAGSRPPL